MSTKKAAKKPAAKTGSAADAAPKQWDFTIEDDGSFDENPLNSVRDGDTILIHADPDLCFDIKVTIKKKKCAGSGGGPIIIHS